MLNSLKIGFVVRALALDTVIDREKRSRLFVTLQTSMEPNLVARVI